MLRPRQVLASGVPTSLASITAIDVSGQTRAHQLLCQGRHPVSGAIVEETFGPTQAARSVDTKPSSGVSFPAARSSWLAALRSDTDRGTNPDAEDHASGSGLNCVGVGLGCATAQRRRRGDDLRQLSEVVKAVDHRNRTVVTGGVSGELGDLEEYSIPPAGRSRKKQN
jgi:hypothetical protein